MDAAPAVVSTESELAMQVEIAHFDERFRDFRDQGTLYINAAAAMVVALVQFEFDNYNSQTSLKMRFPEYSRERITARLLGADGVGYILRAMQLLSAEGIKQLQETVNIALASRGLTGDEGDGQEAVIDLATIVPLIES